MKDDATTNDSNAVAASVVSSNGHDSSDKRPIAVEILNATSQMEPFAKKSKDNNWEATATASDPKTSPSQSNSAATNKSPSAVVDTVDVSALVAKPDSPAAPAAAAEDTLARRPRRGAAAVAVARFAAETTKPTKPKKKQQQQQEDAEEEFKMAWICCECKEAECMMHQDADQLLICEGSCRRLFHYPCAGLSQPPAQDEPYICLDCRNGKHLCALCHTYGTDNEDVFACCAPKCGLFFHEACLLMLEIDVTLVEDHAVAKMPSTDEHVVVDEASRGAGASRREFKCPAHFCWTCCQKDLVEKEKKQAAETRSAEKKKKGRKKTKPSNAFGQKTGQLTIRCLVCPNSYHVTCIPPTARFNELSLLCPDHVAGNKLPDVDPETSVQNKIEKNIDAKFAQSDSPSRRRKKANIKNPFFHGMAGKTMSKLEQELVSGFENDAEMGPMKSVLYCMPANIRDEVYAKPPSYKHLHTNKYNPDNSPEQIKHTGGTCNCIHHCDETCFNRLLYVECTRDKGVSGTNCAVGKSCGNRQLGQRKFKKCKPKREQGKGWGLVVQEDVKKGDLIIEYVGEVIYEKTKEERLAAWAEEHPNDPNFYIMSLGKGWYLDARNEANLARFINHSCDPNAIVHTVNVNGYLRNAIFALRDIRAGTFLSYDYHFETMRGDRFVCRCGSLNCRGTMKDRAVVADDSEKSKRQIWEAAKREYDRDKAFLEDFYAKRAERHSQVDAMVPEWEFPNKDLVSNGPQERHRYEAARSRLFLWRNARLGADFSMRFDRLEGKQQDQLQGGKDTRK